MPVPQHCPCAAELDDLELLLAGGFAPLTGYAVHSPVALHVPSDVAAAAAEAGALELVDPEGLPLARVDVESIRDGRVLGAVTALARPAYGPFRRLHLTPAEVHERYAGALFVPVDTYLSTTDVLLVNARRRGRRVVLLAMCGAGTPRGLTAIALLRVSLAAIDALGDAHVVAVPLARHGDRAVDAELRKEVVANYAAGEVFDQVDGKGAYPASFTKVLDADRGRRPGVVVFFTGLSGSGKSTLARALHDLVLEQGERTVTSLDGDVVRRNLSAGLGFSKADRETNIRRIGWVAAEIARHGGIAIVSPIAPFDATRKQVRAMVEDAGGTFVLVHVATPLEECERRDRKGLYAKARRGEIPEFTGISSPYDEPADAAVRVDTTGRTIAEALARVIRALPFKLPAPDPARED